MIKVVVFLMIFVLLPQSVCAGTLLEVIHGIGARNGIIILVQADEEIMRVLVPGDIALVRDDGRWRRIEKGWPADIEEWSQYLRNADNNAVSRDRVGPPRRLRWTGGTRWARSHMSSVTVISMVTAGGRLYTIEDLETPEYHSLPGRYFLIARDAFNGMKLWQRPLMASGRQMAT